MSALREVHREVPIRDLPTHSKKQRAGKEQLGATGRGQHICVGPIKPNVAVTCSKRLTNPEGTGSLVALSFCCGGCKEPRRG